MNTEKLGKIIEKLATINIDFDYYISDHTLLYKELCWVEDELVKLKND